MKLSPNIEIQPLDDSLLVLDLDQNAYYSLNGTARFFIEKIQQSHGFDRIVEDALVEYGIEKSRISRDFKLLLEELVRLKIVIE